MSKGFVAINFIRCEPNYVSRFEELFRTRARAIERMAGFRSMAVLKPKQSGEPYLVVSHWDSEEAFEAWTRSPEFLEGHRRGFDDMRKAKESGQNPPMTSEFKTYEILTD
ncbi:MAG: antibiotic biosynthesis monooxygenase [Chitinophagales bacterium]|nr:antibiotic biosynthesis monooxygenase [Chitinophagales bacterium]MDW8428619.1 antibiotic biosynthesis monooxygenase [Chitinophagales bacterium]